MYKQIQSNKRRSTFLIIIFFILILALGYAVDYIYEGGMAITLLALVIAIAMTLLSYYSGDKIALSINGAKEIQKDDNPYLYRMVENLSITSGLTMPKVYIIPSQGLNAFATGRDPEHASVAVTQGLIDRLENEELEGVIAHELSHIKNYDIRLMMLVIVLVGTVSLMADIFLRSGLLGRSKSKNSGGGILAIIGLALILLSPIIAKLIQLAISRKREFLADADGALLTRYPQGLARALEKISVHPEIERANTSTAHLFIANPLKKGFWAKMFSTHPPIEERIKILRSMA